LGSLVTAPPEQGVVQAGVVAGVEGDGVVAAMPSGVTLTGGGTAAGGGEPSTESAANVVWLALAAVLVLPAGIGTLGYLAWRLINRNS
jgi:hypothetical protein